MSQKPKKPSAGKKYPRQGKPLNVWLDAPLRDALDALLAKSRRSLTAEVAIALEKHLASEGLWPPPEKKESDR